MNIFERYGLKEVADVQLIAVEDDPARGVVQGDTVLFFDTLKLSNLIIEAEEVKYYGGYGGSVIASWSYNKDVSLTLQDALMSMESLALAFGAQVEEASAQAPIETNLSDVFYLANNLPTTNYKWVSLANGNRGSKQGATGAPAPADFPVRAFWTNTITQQSKAQTVVIDAESFPGTYRIVGHGTARRANGQDRNIQFTIPYAKILSGTTLTVDGGGEPAIFDIALKALARNDSELLQITFYRIVDPLQFYLDVINRELVLGGQDLDIKLQLDGEYLMLRDRSAPPVKYSAVMEENDLVLKYKE